MFRGTLATLGVAFMAACSDPDVVPTSPLVATRGTATAVTLPVTPSSLGWQEQARTLVGGANMSALAAARVYAALGVAQYQAVRAIHDPNADGLIPGNGIGAGGRSTLEARRGAIAGASSRVLSFLFPSAAATLQARVDAEGAVGPGNVHPQFRAGETVGREAGNAMVARLAADRFTTPWTGTVPTGPGRWIANGPPAGATFGGVSPYFLVSGSQFRSAPPPEWNSPAFLADLAEIRTLTLNRTAAQHAIALQWNYGTGTFTPPGYWNRTAAGYIEASRMDEQAATQVFAIMNAAMMDALVACWEAKYFYWTIRPSQVEAMPLSFGLPNHPSYPSGHSCVSSAAATVLAEHFPEHQTQLAEWVTEAGLSRMYAGIHYRFDITAGQALGAAVARWAMQNAHLLD